MGTRIGVGIPETTRIGGLRDVGACCGIAREGDAGGVEQFHNDFATGGVTGIDEPHIAEGRGLQMMIDNEDSRVGRNGIGHFADPFALRDVHDHESIEVRGRAPGIEEIPGAGQPLIDVRHRIRIDALYARFAETSQ